MHQYLPHSLFSAAAYNTCSQKDVQLTRGEMTTSYLSFFHLQTMQNWKNYFILSNPILLVNLDRNSGFKVSKGESVCRSINRLHSREELLQKSRCATAFSCCFKSNLDPNRCKNWGVNFNMLVYIDTFLYAYVRCKTGCETYWNLGPF